MLPEGEENQIVRSSPWAYSAGSAGVPVTTGSGVGLTVGVDEGSAAVGGAVVASGSGEAGVQPTSTTATASAAREPRSYIGRYGVGVGSGVAVTVGVGVGVGVGSRSPYCGSSLSSTGTSICLPGVPPYWK
jgi:hypothetical protein